MLLFEDRRYNRAMRRRLLIRVFALLCVIPSLAAAAMWVRSFWVRDAIPESLHGSGCSIRSWDGRVFILVVNVAKRPGLVVSITTPGIEGSNRNFPDAKQMFPLVASDLQEIRRRKNTLEMGMETVPRGSIRNGFGFCKETLMNATYDPNRRYSMTIVTIPYWAICAVGLLAPLSWWIRFGRGWRFQPGHCPSCGYDLRATPQRCPECGTEINALRAAQ